MGTETDFKLNIYIYIYIYRDYNNSKLYSYEIRKLTFYFYVSFESF